jgi:hypothetical protein
MFTPVLPFVLLGWDVEHVHTAEATLLIEARVSTSPGVLPRLSRRHDACPGLGHMTVNTFGKKFFHTLHMAFKTNRISAEVARSIKESCCGNMAIRLG